MRDIPYRRSGLLVQRRNAHLAYQALNPAPEDSNTLPVQLILDAAKSHVRMLQMQLIDPPHQFKLFGRRLRGEPIDASSGQAEKLELVNYTQRMLALNHRLALSVLVTNDSSAIIGPPQKSDPAQSMLLSLYLGDQL